MGWREDAKFKIGRIGSLYLGEANAQMGTLITATPAEINSLDHSANLQSAEHGAGAIGTAVAPKTYRWTSNGHIITEIHVDLTGLGCKGDAANDVIGLAAGGVAYIGRYVTATNGIVYKGTVACLETPGQGTATITTDIDIAFNSSALLEYDGAAGAAEMNLGGLAAGSIYEVTDMNLTANDYIYLVEGDTAATTGVYNAGMIIVTLYGHALLA